MENKTKSTIAMATLLLFLTIVIACILSTMRL
jgi:hypothetical protein